MQDATPASAISTEAITAGNTTKRKKRPQVATPIASDGKKGSKARGDNEVTTPCHPTKILHGEFTIDHLFCPHQREFFVSSASG